MNFILFFIRHSTFQVYRIFSFASLSIRPCEKDESFGLGIHKALKVLHCSQCIIDTANHIFTYGFF